MKIGVNDYMTNLGCGGWKWDFIFIFHDPIFVRYLSQLHTNKDISLISCFYSNLRLLKKVSQRIIRNKIVLSKILFFRSGMCTLILIFVWTEIIIIAYFLIKHIIINIEYKLMCSICEFNCGLRSSFGREWSVSESIFFFMINFSKIRSAFKIKIFSFSSFGCEWRVSESIFFFMNKFFKAEFLFLQSLSGPKGSIDPYIYMVLNGLVELPVYIFGGSIVERFGRRGPIGIGFLISGAALLVLPFTPTGDSSWVLVLALVGKLCISASYMMLYVLANELFPTVMRQQGMGYSAFAGSAGSSISAFITEILSLSVSWAPAAVFGGLSLVAGVLTFLLHETNKEPLPDTIQDLKENMRKRKINKTVGGIASSAENDLLKN
ncbi:unnamed protein product, partial [Meganyctiphanes norvegica]